MEFTYCSVKKRTHKWADNVYEGSKVEKDMRPFCILCDKFITKIKGIKGVNKMANKEQKGQKNVKKVAKKSLKEKRAEKKIKASDTFKGW